MSNSPRVCVVIPTYNRASILRETLQSVLAQSIVNYEVLVVDDASTDDTRQVVESFKDQRFIYYRQTHNVGPNYNLRYGLNVPHTEFVAFLSDDDLLVPDHLAIALEALDTFPQAAYYASFPIRFGRGQDEVFEPPTILKSIQPLTYIPPSREVDFLGMDTPGMAHFVARRNVVQNIAYWDSRDFLPTDILIMPQMMIQGGFVFGNRPTTRVRLHGATVSNVPGKKGAVRFNLMVWSSIRYTIRLLLDKKLCTLDDIVEHGLKSLRYYQVVPLVLALGSFHSSREFQKAARRIFCSRRDMDAYSDRFRLARRVGFWSIPCSEQISELHCRWHPKQ
jgi:glycosyltransferase involved in cell wall biosynthesis